MSSLRLFLFGSPRLEWDNAVLNITRRKALALLIYLVMTGKTQGRDTLATLFWPDSSQSQDRTALSRHLSELNKILPEDVLTLDVETVSLRGRLWLDVVEFEAALAACPETTAACLPAFERAVALYNDDFWAGFTLPDCPDFEAWQFFQSESLRQSLSLALKKLASVQAEGRDFEKAIATTRRWLVLDPLNEAAHRALMQCYAQTGQPAAALCQYQLCQESLEQELDLAPRVETTALYEASVGAQSKLDSCKMGPNNLQSWWSISVNRPNTAKDISPRPNSYPCGSFPRKGLPSPRIAPLS
jgi:DNA-binding SARP family transcriptional activator